MLDTETRIPRGYLQGKPLPRSKAIRLLAGGILAALGFLVPLVLDKVWMGLAVSAVVLGLFALSIGWLSSKAGLLSLGHSAFYGSSAFFVAIASTRWGWDLTQAFFGAIGFSVVLGVLIGMASVRVGGIGFAMVTLAFGQAIYLLSVQESLRSTTGGDDGLSVGFGDFLWISSSNMNHAGLWPVVWISVLAVCALLAIVNRSSFGLLLEAIRDNQERAKFSGFNTYLPRVAAFTLSALVAGVAGALFAVTIGFVSPQNLFWLASAYAIISAVIGGVNTIGGPLLGAVIYVLLTDRFASTGNFDLYLGATFVVVMVLIPAGLAGLPAMLRTRRGQKNERNGRTA
jgi:branched-chain amino acid transport system permease protein